MSIFLLRRIQNRNNNSDIVYNVCGKSLYEIYPTYYDRTVYCSGISPIEFIR